MKIAINIDETTDRFYDALHHGKPDDHSIDIDDLDAVLDCFDTLAKYVDFLWYDDETREYKSIRDSNIILSEYFSAGSDTIYLSARELRLFEQSIDNVLNRYGIELVATIEVDRDVR